MSDRYTDLVKLPGYDFPLYASAGVEGQAHAIAGRCCHFDQLAELARGRSVLYNQVARSAP